MQVICMIFIMGISEILGKEASMIIVNRSAPTNRRIDGFKVNLSVLIYSYFSLLSRKGENSGNKVLP